MKKIIVTGGLGFIGSNLIDLLLEKNYKVLNIDKINPGATMGMNFLIMVLFSFFTASGYAFVIYLFSFAIVKNFFSLDVAKANCSAF